MIYFGKWKRRSDGRMEPPLLRRDRMVAKRMLRGDSCKDVAAAHGLSTRTIYDIMAKYRRGELGVIDSEQQSVVKTL